MFGFLRQRKSALCSPKLLGRPGETTILSLGGRFSETTPTLRAKHRRTVRRKATTPLTTILQAATTIPMVARATMQGRPIPAAMDPRIPALAIPVARIPAAVDTTLAAAAADTIEEAGAAATTAA